MSHPGQSVFQPREGDLCTWVDQSQFFDLDDEIQEEDYALQELLSGYKIVAAALQKANLRFAAIGGIALAVLGGRSSDNMTHDVDLVFNGTVVQLFDTLRITKGLRLRKGLQTDNFRIHCQISEGRWVGVDLLARNSSVAGHTTDHDGVIMLQITPLVASKLHSFHARQAARDADDIAFLVVKFPDLVRKNELDKSQVAYFLEHAELKGSVKEQIQKILG